MSKVVLFTDNHISLHKNMEMFADVALNAITEVCDYAEKNNIDTIWNLGDTFQLKDKIESHLAIKAKPYFERLKDFNNKFLIGNHDLHTKNDSTYNILELYDNYIDIVKDYEVVEIGDVAFHFVSYNANHLISNRQIKTIEGKVIHFFCLL